MNKTILTIVCTLSCIMSAVAQIGYRQDDITYCLNTDESGNNYAIVLNNTNKKRSNVVIPETITYDGNDYVVTEIGDEAFYCNTYLESVTLPNTIRQIGDSAFLRCGSTLYLKNLSINLPESLTHIGKAAFKSTSLKSIKIPGTVQHISDEAFRDCRELRTADIGYGTKSIGALAFNFCLYLDYVTIPSSVETIGNFAFLNCLFLKTLNLKGVQHIGIQAFRLTALSDVVLSDNLDFIGSWAFGDCKFKNISLPSSLTTIGDHAFENNTLLEGVCIPKNVTTIGKEIFSGCSILRRIAVPIRFKPNSSQCFPNINAICWYGDDAEISDEGIIYSANYSRLVYVPKTYTGVLDIPSSTTSIGAYAAYRCTDISEMNLPTSLKEIEPYAFYYTPGFTKVDLPNIKYIGEYAFYDTPVRYLSINENIDSIGKYAFFYYPQDFIFPLGISATTMQNAFNGLYKFACNKTFDYETVIYRIEDFSPPYVPVFYDETDIVENGIIFNSAKNIIKYASNQSIPTEYTIPAHITEIADNAFYHCLGLRTLSIPEGVKSIGENAFKECRIETLHIPASITSIGSGAFITALVNPNIYYNTAAPISANKNIFSASEYDNSILYIPKGTLSKFLLKSPWMYFRNIQEIDFSGIDGVESDECSDAPVEYYNLQGMRVENPTSGIYIRRQGSKTSKVFLRQD